MNRMRPKNSDGIGGWLALLVAILILFGPLRAYGELTSTLKNWSHEIDLIIDGDHFVYVYKGWFFAAATFSVAAGYRLLTIFDPSSVRFAIASLWVTGPLYGLVQYGILIVYFERYPLSALVVYVLFSVASAVVWTAYLRKSDRVKRTYDMVDMVENTGDMKRGDQQNFTPSISWWRQQKKEFRVWVFVSFIWALSVFVYCVIFRPWGNYGPSDNEFFEVIVTAGIPIYAALMRYLYIKLI